MKNHLFKTTFLLSFLFLTLFGSAQITNHDQPSFICSYYGEPITGNVIGFNSTADARNVISDIMDVIGLQSNFQIRASNIPNAAAVISSGQRYILYNPQFIH